MRPGALGSKGNSGGSPGSGHYCCTQIGLDLAMGASNIAEKQEPCPVTAQFGHCWLLNAVEMQRAPLVPVQLLVRW